MGKGARNRAKRSKPEPLPSLGTFEQPEGIAWTPIEQLCQCVIEWGWHDETCDPMTFMQFVAKMPLYPCGWHGAETGRPVQVSRSGTLVYTDAGKPPFFYIRRALPEREVLGQRISRELKRVLAMSDQDMAAVVEGMHPSYRAFLGEEGYDPRDAWMESKLTDLILNCNPSSNPFGWQNASAGG